MPHIALLTDSRYVAATAAADDWYHANILHDDALLQQALLRHNVSCTRVDWADPAVDWSAFDLAVFRTTWDYYEKFEAFSAWLHRTEKLLPLCNLPEIIRWNMDKHYLRDLHDGGVPVVPFRFIEKGTSPDLGKLLEETGWKQAVIKPCVSGGARLTYRVDAGSSAAVAQKVAPWLEKEAFILQPYIASVETTGEDSLMVLGGTYSHAVRKIPRQGDFRVQDDHGGTVHPRQPDDTQKVLAERAMVACTATPVYGRADMVQMPDGSWAIMELELLEPELWIRYHPESALLFAEAMRKFFF